MASDVSVCPGVLVLIIWNVAEYLFRTAAEYSTQIVQSLSADGLVLPELVQGGTGYIVMVDKRIS